MQLREFSEMMIMLSKAYPTAKIDEDNAKAYYLFLADIPDERLVAGFRYAVTHSPTFFPTAPQIRDACFTIQFGTMGLPSEFEAWDEVVKQIASAGYYREPTFSTPLISRAIEGIGGWQNLCLSENIEYDRAHFIKAYQSTKSRAEEWERLPDSVKKQLPSGTQGAMQQLAQKLALPEPCKNPESVIEF